MDVLLLNHTRDADRTVAVAARLCYSKHTVKDLRQELTQEKIEQLIAGIVRSGHHSVLEHASFTYGIEGISRVTTHQLVRHRLASYSQQSQRYTRLDRQSGFIVPESIAKDPGMDAKFAELSKSALGLYLEMLENGIPAEDARYILPGAVNTRIIVTMNARELLHFFRLRTCLRAQWEIRAMAVEMLRLARPAAPVIFRKAGPACISGPCPEGDFYCGKLREVRAFYRGL
ncbi:MAG: FAD-dependent thymidylate synthase [Deltaproteobacteria bacterium]|nr:FAD-dependent thymidylate synthase [Deltaproteobacteria bacterium]